MMRNENKKNTRDDDTTESVKIMCGTKRRRRSDLEKQAGENR